MTFKDLRLQANSPVIFIDYSIRVNMYTYIDNNISEKELSWPLNGL